MSDKAVITCALNGVLTDPKQHNVPVTPEQMAREAKAAFEAEGLAKPGDRVSRFYDCCAAERSLALLDSCYEVR